MGRQLYATRNPYEECELFAMLERLRRNEDTDGRMDDELGELIMSAARYAMTCGLRKGMRFDHDEAEEMCIAYALDASRKASTENPHRFVSYIVAAVQTNWKRDSMLRANREKLLFPVGTGDAITLGSDIDGTAEGMGPWESLRIFTIKNEEAENGQEDKTPGGCPGGSQAGAGGDSFCDDGGDDGDECWR